MDSPDPQDPKFGSEVRRLETPEHRRRRRRKSVAAAVFGIVMGAVLLVVGVLAARAGEMISHPGSFPLTGEELSALAVIVMALSGWLLWRLLTNRQ